MHFHLYNLTYTCQNQTQLTWSQGLETDGDLTGPTWVCFGAGTMSRSLQVTPQTCLQAGASSVTPGLRFNTRQGSVGLGGLLSFSHQFISLFAPLGSDFLSVPMYIDVPRVSSNQGIARIDHIPMKQRALHDTSKRCFPWARAPRRTVRGLQSLPCVLKQIQEHAQLMRANPSIPWHRDILKKEMVRPQLTLLIYTFV